MTLQKILRCGLLVLWPHLYNYVYAQQNAIPLLKPGDSLPSITVADVLNYSSDQLSLTTLRGKLVILDFWNHRCGSCIKAFPKLDSLQKKFNDRIQIVLVNRESREATEAFFKKFKHIKKPDVPIITGDSILSACFPAQYFPSHVWVDTNGIVRYISGGYNTTEENIQAFLNDRSNEIKNFDNAVIKSGPHLSHIYSDWETATLHYSSLTRCRDSVDVFNESGNLYANGKTVRISSNCASVLELLLKAFNGNDQYQFGKDYNTILEVRDSAAFIRPANPNSLDAWSKYHCYSYELLLPVSQIENSYQYMQEYLKNAFGLNVRIEKRRIRGLSFRASYRKNNYQNRDTADNYRTFIKGETNEWRFENLPLSSFINRLSIHLGQEQPFVTEAFEERLLSFSIPSIAWKEKGYSKLISLLKKQGLILKEKLIETDVLVIKKSTDD